MSSSLVLKVEDKLHAILVTNIPPKLKVEQIAEEAQLLGELTSIYLIQDQVSGITCIIIFGQSADMQNILRTINNRDSAFFKLFEMHTRSRKGTTALKLTTPCVSRSFDKVSHLCCWPTAPTALQYPIEISLQVGENATTTEEDGATKQTSTSPIRRQSKTPTHSPIPNPNTSHPLHHLSDHIPANSTPLSVVQHGDLAGKVACTPEIQKDISHTRQEPFHDKDGAEVPSTSQKFPLSTKASVPTSTDRNHIIRAITEATADSTEDRDREVAFLDGRIGKGSVDSANFDGSDDSSLTPRRASVPNLQALVSTKSSKAPADRRTPNVASNLPDIVVISPKSPKATSKLVPLSRATDNGRPNTEQSSSKNLSLGLTPRRAIDSSRIVIRSRTRLIPTQVATNASSRLSCVVKAELKKEDGAKSAQGTSRKHLPIQSLPSKPLLKRSKKSTIPLPLPIVTAPPRFNLYSKGDVINDSRGIKYEMIAELGAGGHGQVVSARTMATGRLVAIKSHADPHGIIIFQNEVRMLRFVGESEENRHCIQLLDEFSVGGRAHIVLPLLYCSLSNVVHDHNLQTIRVHHSALFCQQSLEGLAYLKSIGVLHRDIKSENILIEQVNENDYNAKLGDFGIAAFVEEEAKKPVPKPKFLMGTWNYLAPELIKGETSSYPSDLWALACVFYELVFCKTLFNDYRKNHEEHFIAIKDFQTVFVVSILPTLGLNTEDKLLMKLAVKILVDDPEDRPTVQEALNDKYFSDNLVDSDSDDLDSDKSVSDDST